MLVRPRTRVMLLGVFGAGKGPGGRGLEGEKGDGGGLEEGIGGKACQQTKKANCYNLPNQHSYEMNFPCITYE